MTEDLMQHLHDLGKIEETVSQKNERDADDFWDSLSQDDKERAFYSVCKRIYDGDVDQRGSYRYVLYNVFGFDKHMYARGMDCGYMAIHNAIFEGNELQAMGGVNRIEVIDENGRAYVRWDNDPLNMSYQLQDDDRTLKVFVDGKYK